MDSFLGQVFAAIPAAAASPIALVAYLAALTVGGFIVYRLRRYSTVGKLIADLPESDRIEAMRTMLGEVPVGQFTPSEYIRLKVVRYIFYIALVACATFVTISGMAVKEVLDRETLTNNLIQNILESPTPQFQSSLNRVLDAPDRIRTISAASDPNPTFAEEEALIEKLVSEGYRQDEIFAVLAQLGFGGEFQKLNQRLIQSVANVDSQFLELIECFEQQRCSVKASKFPLLCEYLNRISANLEEANREASEVPGVFYNQTGSDPLFGSGVASKYWDEVTAKNVSRLNQRCA